MFTADSICEMIEFLIDNIFVQFGGRLFRQVIGIPMGASFPSGNWNSNGDQLCSIAC